MPKPQILETETPRRSVAKAVSYRMLSILVTVTVVFLFTGKVNIAVSVGILDGVLKIFLYYFHERAWSHFIFGNNTALR